MKPVCLVTGSGGRLGSALCDAFVGEYDILAVYRSRAPKIASQLARPIADIGRREEEALLPGVHCIQADLSKRDDLRRLVEVGLARFGRIDMVVNAAADTRFHGRLTELWDAPDYAESQLALNSVAPLRLVSAVFQSCWKDARDENARWNRSVVNISSAAALYVAQSQGQAFYGASKAALNLLTMHLSTELAPYSVRANAICPGTFRDAASTSEVVDRIRQLIEGGETGRVS